PVTEPSENWSGGYVDAEIGCDIRGAVRIFDLAVALEPGMPRHPHHPPFAYGLAKRHKAGSYGNGVSTAMEVITTGAHVGTHIDALGHVAKDGKAYGGRDVMSAQSCTEGLGVGSIEETPPIIGPGHLVDVPKLLGRDPTPADGLGPAEFERWFADKAEPGPGSIVLVRTGWMRLWDVDEDDYI